MAMGYLEALVGTGRMGQSNGFSIDLLNHVRLRALASAGAASAQVLSIGDDGAVTTYSGPAVYTTEGATAIAPPETPTLMRAPPEEVVRMIQGVVRPPRRPRLDRRGGGLAGVAFQSRGSFVKGRARCHATVTDNR